MKLSDRKGKLVIIGGAEDKQNDCKILREFVRLCGGVKARIVIMTVATQLPGEVGQDYISVFERLGVENVQVVDTAVPEDANSSEAIELINEATGVFFTGGDQARITKHLLDSKLYATLHERFKEGLIVAGTSAGAAMMPDVMIVEGEGETNPRLELVTMDKGMGFLPEVIIDQHFAQRGRLGRLVSALTHQPTDLGFGIDENTALFVNGAEIEIIGAGAVTVLDVSSVTHTNLEGLLKDEPLSLCGAKLHILPHGYKYNLETRSPIWQ